MLSRTALRFLSLRRPIARFLSTPAEADHGDPSKDPEFLRSLEQSKGRTHELSHEDDFYWHNAPVVSAVTSYSKKHGAQIGIFWEPNNEYNVLKNIPSQNYGAASLESMIAVLRQAVYDRHVDKLIVYTGSDYIEKLVNRYLPVWKANDFVKKDGTEVKHRELIEELASLVEKLQLKVKHASALKDKEVKEALESEFASESFHDEVIEQNKKKKKYTFNIAELSEFGPVVYTAAAENVEGSFRRGGYAVKWADKEYELLDDTRRLNMVPATLFRSQLCAIILALETAIEQGLKKIVIVTDSYAFLRWQTHNWTTDSGKRIANYSLYCRILTYMEEIDVKFVVMPDKSEPGSDVEQVRLMAEDGLAYPILKETERKWNQKFMENAPTGRKSSASKEELTVEEEEERD
ncbi:hypothetical protein QR680_005820 [Steinernema hermaphroditum]|uniref:ribonuclease H n=1 Tax=Steinernema hermaphroditum TaxID=289476 RepID=A0AA39HVL8_9BILA|nr:hypothetical protein QR680_005820 [Steinernema hermaphroditum]